MENATLLKEEEVELEGGSRITLQEERGGERWEIKETRSYTWKSSR